MKDWQCQAHVRWDCKYHVVILPKYRQEGVFWRRRRGIGANSREIVPSGEYRIAGGQGNAGPHPHAVEVPPRYSIAMAMGYLKGKSAIRIHRELLSTKGTLFGRSFWARGYCVSTVGLDEDVIRRYIRNQEKLQRDRDQGELNLE